MDANQFDILTRSLRFAGTRRRLLGILTAFGAAGSLLMLPVEETSARHQGKHRRKRNHRQSGRRKDNRRGKSMGQAPNTQSACAIVLTGAGCTQVSDGRSIVWQCAENTNLENADLSNCSLIGAQLKRVNLNGVNLNGSILNNAHLDGAQLHHGSFRKTDFVQAIAPLANFGGAIDTSGADMRDATFTGASFNSADLGGADLRGAKMQDADLREVVWPGARCPHGHLVVLIGDCCGHLNGSTTPQCS